MSTANEPKLTTGDLFAGAGGLSVGFHLAGFTPLFFNEIDPIASQTYSSNFPNAIPFVCPIQDLNTTRVKKECGVSESEALDVMIGGPPCQGFSINAPVRGNSDPRNHLFRHYIRLVLEGLHPKFIVMENVPGLVSLDGGKTLQDVLKAFEIAGYNVAFKILNSAHYGVPQERWRLIIMGTCVPGITPSFPQPTHYSLQRTNFTGGRDYTFRFAIGPSNQIDMLANGLAQPITVAEAIDDLPMIESGGGCAEMDYTSQWKSEYQHKMRGRSKKLHNHICSGVAQINLERIRCVKPGGSWRDIPFDLLPKGLKRARRSDHTKRYGRLDPGGLSGTIMTKCDPHWGTFFHYSQDRILSVREAARLQSFPDTFRFMGSRTEQYRQVGNAVPPLMAYAIANQIKLLLSEQSLNKKSPTMRKRSHAKSKG